MITCCEKVKESWVEKREREGRRKETRGKVRREGQIEKNRKVQTASEKRKENNRSPRGQEK